MQTLATVARPSPATAARKPAVLLQACGGRPCGCRHDGDDRRTASSGLGRIQFSLEVGTADSPYEREAEAAARQVTAGRMTQPPALSHLSASSAAAERASSPADPLDADRALAAVRSPGEALSPESRQFFGARFQHDFGSVRIHADEPAARAAAGIGAAAFTVGNHIVFGAGRYRSGGGASDGLIAHELAHVVQQGASPPTTAFAQRQHEEGGPYHPPEGTELSCGMDDSCSDISTKINYLRHTIKRHQEWDIANPDPAYPQGRHFQEILDLGRALANCIRIAQTKCRNQPEYVPVPQEEHQPQEDPEQRQQRVRQQLYDALPWAVAVVVIGLVIACVIAEPCGAAVLAALAAVLEAEEMAIVLGILAANRVPTGG